MFPLVPPLGEITKLKNASFGKFDQHGRRKLSFLSHFNVSFSPLLLLFYKGQCYYDVHNSLSLSTSKFGIGFE